MPAWLGMVKDALFGKGLYDPEILQTVQPRQVFGKLDHVREMHRKHYAKLCREMRQMRLAGTRDRLAEAERRLSENLEAMIGQVQRVTWAERQARVLREEMGETQRRLSQEYVKLRQLPVVREVTARDGVVEVTTITTHLPHQGKLYRIGRIRFLIDPSGYLTVNNLTQAVVRHGKRYDHPYVVEGKLGPVEVLGVAAGMICKGEVSELVAWLEGYLGDYDAQRAVCPVQAWPVVNLDELVEVQKQEQAELAVEREVTTQDLFVQACLEPWRARLAEAQRAVAETERNYEALYNEIHVQQRRIEELKKSLIRLELEGDKEERYAEEYALLCQLPGVREVRVKQGLIEVFTDTIYISHRGRRHRIGDFRIDLWVGDGVRIQELENRLIAFFRGCSHPHIQYSQPCFGNVERRISKELSGGNFKDVILLCLEFLQSYNPQSTYGDITAWSETRGR